MDPMRASRSLWRRCRRILGVLAAPVLLSLCPQAPAADPPATPPPVLVAPPPRCRSTIWRRPARRQCRISRASSLLARSLAAGALKQEAVDRIKLGALIARDVPIRKKQAALGVSIAEAAVQTAECDARNAATFCYLAVLFARVQQKTVADSKTHLNDLKDLIKTAAEKGRRDVYKDEQTALVDSFLTLLDGRNAEATTGEQRALAARAKRSASVRIAPLTLLAANSPTSKPRSTAT